jgi:hypothetical protein
MHGGGPNPSGSRAFRLTRRTENRVRATVVTVLALPLGVVMSAYAAPEFEQASAVARVYQPE